MDIREAELRRVKADGVVEGREAVVARLDKGDIGALVSALVSGLSYFLAFPARSRGKRRLARNQRRGA